MTIYRVVRYKLSVDGVPVDDMRVMGDLTKPIMVVDKMDTVPVGTDKKYWAIWLEFPDDPHGRWSTVGGDGERTLVFGWEDGATDYVRGHWDLSLREHVSVKRVYLRPQSTIGGARPDTIIIDDMPPHVQHTKGGHAMAQIEFPIKTTSINDQPGWVRILDNNDQLVCDCPGVEMAQSTFLALNAAHFQHKHLETMSAYMTVAAVPVIAPAAGAES